MSMRTTAHPTFDFFSSFKFQVFGGGGVGGGGGGQQRGIAAMNTKRRPVAKSRVTHGALEAYATSELLGSGVRWDPGSVGRRKSIR